jgi:hypothetical protein
MENDWDTDGVFGDPGDNAIFYGVPNDHPAFGGQGNDDEGDGSGRDFNEAGDNVLQLPVGRYDGYSNQDRQEPDGVPGTGDVRQRVAERELRDREARAEGTRSIREHAVAQQHSGSTENGSTDSRTDEKPTRLESQLAASLDAAGASFRELLEGDDRADIVNKVEATPLRGRHPRGIPGPPKFRGAKLHGQLSGLKSNASGSWILTFIVDPDSLEEITKLGAGHGLGLDIVITRVSRD